MNIGSEIDGSPDNQHIIESSSQYNTNFSNINLLGLVESVVSFIRHVNIEFAYDFPRCVHA